MARVNVKLGDVFLVKIGNKRKYFQYVANDSTQLNSDVIRAFKKSYSIDENPKIEDLINQDIDFYAHCIIKMGLKMALWEKVGNISNVGEINDVLFRSASDYARKAGEEPIKLSNNWYIWKINDRDFTKIGKLESEYKKAFIGLVMNPNGIIELLKGNKYPNNYPD